MVQLKSEDIGKGSSEPSFESGGCQRSHVILVIHKDRAAPPIGGPALHDSRVKTVQWRKREGHDSYQEVEVYIYKWAITKNGYTRSGFFAERVLSKTK